MYICLPSGSSEQFLVFLESTLGKMGHPASRGRAVDDHHRVDNVLESNTVLTNVWVQNGTVYNERAADPVVPNPNEFYIAVSPRIPFFRADADSVFRQLRARLLNAGYRIASNEEDCKAN
jgi:hypothetical protein